MKFRNVLSAAALVAAAIHAQSSCGTPFTTWNMTASNGQAGVMFDLENMSTSPINICGLEMNMDSSTVPMTLEVWTVTAGTSHVAVATTASAWTRQVQAVGVTSLGINTTGIGNTFTPVPGLPPITINPGQRLGFACAMANGTSQNYQTGATGQGVGTSISNDGTVKFYVGYGKSYTAGVGPFGTNFGTTTAGRIASVKVGWVPAGPPPPPKWELNSPASNLDIDGVSTTAPLGLAAAVRTQCVGNQSNLNLASTNVGLPYEIAYGLAAPVAGGAGALATASGQLLNVDLADPTASFLFGLSFAVPFTNGAIPFTAPAPFGLSVQMANIDPSNPDGVALSSAVRFQANATASSATFGQTQLTDDGAILITSGAATTSPACLTPISTLPFYGTAYTQAWVASNGRVCFTAGTNTGDYIPVVASAQTQTPSFGFWCDLEPNNSPGCSMVFDWSVPNMLSVAYNNIRYWGQAGLNLTGSMMLDTATGAITLNGMNTFPVFTDNMWLGISKGSLGATDPGATAFAVGTTGSAAAPSDMLYAYGPEGSLVPGVASIVFIPNAAGGYDWAAF